MNGSRGHRRSRATYTATVNQDRSEREIVVHIDGVTDRPLISYRLEPEDDPWAHLEQHGWSIVHGSDSAGQDLVTAPVEPGDIRQIIAGLTSRRLAAQHAATVADLAWRHMIQRAAQDHLAPTSAIAREGKISVERVYQLRDGRR